MTTTLETMRTAATAGRVEPLAPSEGMETDRPALLALQRAADEVSEAATDLTRAMLAAGHTPLGHDARVLAEAVDAEHAAVLCRHRGG